MPRSLSLLLSFLWVLLISFGFYQVYLFVNGYPLFTYGQKQEQKGYISFASSPESLFFMDREYLGSADVHKLYLLGNYTMCAEKLGYISRCFPNSEVRTNDQEMLHYRSITLLPENLEKRTVTEEKVYVLPKKNGFFWYDSFKKQIFWIDQGSENVESVFPEFIPDEIMFDEKENHYVLVKKKTLKLPEQKQILNIGSFSFTPPKAPDLYIPLVQEKNILSHVLPPKNLTSESHKQTIAWFDEKPEQEFSFFTPENKVLVFSSHVFLFSLDAKDFRLLFEKDSSTPVIYFETLRQFWFIHENKLKLLQL